jgi:hypothetical protein
LRIGEAKVIEQRLVDALDGHACGIDGVAKVVFEGQRPLPRGLLCFDCHGENPS